MFDMQKKLTYLILLHALDKVTPVAGTSQSKQIMFSFVQRAILKLACAVQCPFVHLFLRVMDVHSTIN